MIAELCRKFGEGSGHSRFSHLAGHLKLCSLKHLALNQQDENLRMTAVRFVGKRRLNYRCEMMFVQKQVVFDHSAPNISDSHSSSGSFSYVLVHGCFMLKTPVSKDPSLKGNS